MKKTIGTNKIFLLGFFLIGFFLRFYVSLVGFNYDYGSWKIVGEIVSLGKNVYWETTRYSYGPVWALILGFLRQISLFFLNDWFVFRLLLILLLTLTDFLISVIIFRYFGYISFLFIFLNPLSFFISGFHNQFDNLAILIGLWSLTLLEKDRRNIFAYFLLGISISTKHIFLFFPLWLFFLSKTKKEKFYSFIPWLVFLFSFLPFINSKESLFRIINNVFLYKRDLLYSFFPNHSFIVLLFLFIPIIIFFFLFKNERLFYQGLWYLLIFSGSLINSGTQYLIIPLTSYLLNPLFGIFYSLVGVSHIFFNIIPLNKTLIFAFNLTWLLIIYKHIKSLQKTIAIFLLFLSIFFLTIFLRTTSMSIKNLIRSERLKLKTVSIYKNPVKIFTLNLNKKNNPLTNKNIARGSFTAQENNLGLLIIPAFLDNQSEDFFEKDYEIKMRLLEDGNFIHQEIRSFGNALISEGVIFGLPIIKNSKDKKYEIELITNLPVSERSFFLNFDKPFQEVYFFERGQINSFSIFSLFIFYKFLNLILNQNFIILFFQFYCYLWFFLIGHQLFLRKKYL